MPGFKCVSLHGVFLLERVIIVPLLMPEKLKYVCLIAIVWCFWTLSASVAEDVRICTYFTWTEPGWKWVNTCINILRINLLGPTAINIRPHFTLCAIFIFFGHIVFIFMSISYRWSDLCSQPQSPPLHLIRCHIISFPCFTCQRGIPVLFQFWVLIDISP